MANLENLEPWYRLGFITPHQFVDNVPYQFYRLAPPGMMLVTANLDLADYTVEAVDHELPLLWRHAARLKKRGVDRIVIAGVPVGAALGRKRMQAILAEGEDPPSRALLERCRTLAAEPPPGAVERAATDSMKLRRLKPARGSSAGSATRCSMIFSLGLKGATELSPRRSMASRIFWSCW